MTDVRVKDLKLDEIVKLRTQRKEIDDKLKILEKPYKTELFRDGLKWEADTCLMDMVEVTRTLITPVDLQTAHPDIFMDCIEVKMEKTTEALMKKLKLTTKEEAKARVNELGKVVPYQKKLEFTTK